VYTDFLVESVGQGFAGGFKIIPCLKIHPELGLHPKEASQSQRGIRRDAPLAVDNLIDATRRHADCLSHMVLTDLHRFEKIFKQNLTRVDWRKVTLGHGLTSQVTVTPSNQLVVLPARGNDAKDGKAEDPGAIKVYFFKDGQLTPAQDIVGGKNGFDYRPRHVDYHPTQPWLYANIESQNEVHMHRIAGDRIEATPAFIKTSLVSACDPKLHQTTSAIHVHPNGKFVYTANRADAKIEFNGKQVFAGGENSIAVFAIDQSTGEHTRIQSVDPQTHHVRTFSIDPSGRLLVSASIRDMWVKDGNDTRLAPAALSVFRIGDDGKLAFVRKYDAVLNGKLQWWSGIIGL
jgi:6-phosphogluconolactonase